jgi:hypothetical protein
MLFEKSLVVSLIYKNKKIYKLTKHVYIYIYLFTYLNKLSTNDEIIIHI